MANIQISPSTSSQFEPSIAVNWLNPSVMVVVAVDLRTGSPNIGLYKSIDAGATWSTRLLPLPAGFVAIESPHIDYVFPNSFVVVAHAFDADGLSGSIVTYTSNNNASTFGPPVIVNQGFGQFVNDDQVIVVTDKAGSSPFFGNIYTAYTHDYNTQFIPGNTIFFNRSKDGGKTFLDPLLLSSVNEFEEFPGIAITLNGIAIVGWITQPPGPSELRTTTSQDGGATFGIETRVTSVVVDPSPLPGYQFRCLTYPSLAGDISNSPTTRGNVYAVWQDFREGYSDIFLSISTNFGVDWSTPKPIANSPVGAQNFFPTITVSPSDGAVFVSYYTNRVNPPNIDVFLATSRDGGKTFTNTRTTTTSFNVEGIPLIGDYIGNAVVPQLDRLVCVWTDTRTGVENIWFGDNQ
ncbi:exo-alpha-sialidase [Bacillus sp. BRMEA1]|uniref:sialidase family protein n=1 Tax=Neobacillus endophyticus TaxID=2738405 RepID=UPI001567B6D5|nr:sialidase family protein [Neobacillus endophyticus]NRD78501.1 exo-alpha-sialidase [Neobacillus endophyticus]